MSNESEAFTRTLGVDSGRLRLARSQEIAGVSAHLAAQARRELLIHDPRLEPAIYDQTPFLQAVKQLALARPGLCVRVLLSDPRAAAQDGHRLIELARRLTSRIAIQRVADEDQGVLDALLIVDATGYVRRRLVDGMEAIADYDDSPAARRWRLEFEERWERSSTDTELRQLFI
jgi:hypothetical protein